MDLTPEKKIKILVADDENLIRWSLDKYLKEAGYAVDTVANGEEAIKKLEKCHYDIVVTDLNMPKVNGVELLRRMKEMGIFTPVIIISAFLTEDVLQEAPCNNAFKCINKPFLMEDVLNVVQKAAEYKNY